MSANSLFGRGDLLVLMYHFVYDQPPAALRGLPFLPQDKLEEHIRLCQSLGEVWDGSEPLASFVDGSDDRAPRFLLTFDDTLQCQHSHAAPVMEAHGVRGVFSVYSGPFQGTDITLLEVQRIIQYTAGDYQRFLERFYDCCRDEPTIPRDLLPRIEPTRENLRACHHLYPRDIFYTDGERFFRNVRDTLLDYEQFELVANRCLDLHYDRAAIHGQLYMNQEQTSDLALRGHELVGHSHCHPFSPMHFEGDKPQEDIATNLAILARLTGKPIRGYTYPCGFFNQAIIDVLKGLGVSHAFTSAQFNDLLHPGEMRYRIKRLDAALFSPQASEISSCLNRPFV